MIVEDNIDYHREMLIVLLIQDHLDAYDSKYENILTLIKLLEFRKI